MITLLEKIDSLKKKFSHCSSKEEIYQTIIFLGEQLPPLDPIHKTPANRVSGCQSAVYIKSEYKNGKIFLEAASDALISAGLVYLLLTVYSGETPKIILSTQPNFLEELKIPSSLSFKRSNGLAHILLHIKRLALVLER